EELVGLARDDQQLHPRRRTEVVDEEADLVSRCERQVGEYPAEHVRDEWIGLAELRPRDSPFAVETHSDLDLVLAELEGRLTGLGNRSGRDGDPHRAGAVARSHGRLECVLE